MIQLLASLILCPAIVALPKQTGQVSTTKPPVTLLNLRPVTGGFDRDEEPVSAAGMVFDRALFHDDDDYKSTRTAVYDLEKRYVSLVYGIGILDKTRGLETCHYYIYLDGVLALEEEVNRGQRPARRVIDVKGKRSLKVVLQRSVALLDPMLHFTVVPKPDDQSTAIGNAQDTTQKGEAVIEDGIVKLRWQKVKDATSYVVLVIGRLPGKETKSWSYTAKKLPECNISVSDLSPGDFEWMIYPVFDGKPIDKRIAGEAFKLPAKD